MPKRRLVLASVVVVAILALPGCGIRQRLFGKKAATRNGTLTATPTTGSPGTTFSLNAGGFLAGEPMTFEIDAPGQKPFVGPAHTVGADGTVTTSYVPQTGDPAGTYQVKAVGARGTRAQTTLVITSTSPSS